MKILIIEDNEIDALLLRTKLPEHFIGKHTNVFGAMKDDLNYYDLIIVDVMGTYFDDETIVRFDKSKTWITSASVILRASNDYKFVMKSDLVAEIQALATTIKE